MCGIVSAGELVAMQERAEKAEAQVVSWIDTAGDVAEVRDEWVDRAMAAEAQCAVLREALEQVARKGHGQERCLYCSSNTYSDAHAEWCAIGKALATDAGATLLAEVKTLRALAEAVRRQFDGVGAGYLSLEVCSALGALDAGEVTG